MLISAVPQSGSVIHISILFHLLFRCGLSKNTEYSSLCYTGGPSCSNISLLHSVPTNHSLLSGVALAPLQVLRWQLFKHLLFLKTSALEPSG